MSNLVGLNESDLQGEPCRENPAGIIRLKLNRLNRLIIIIIKTYKLLSLPCAHEIYV